MHPNTITEAPQPDPRPRGVCRATTAELREYAELKPRIYSGGEFNVEDLARRDQLEMRIVGVRHGLLPEVATTLALALADEREKYEAAAVELVTQKDEAHSIGGKYFSLVLGLAEISAAHYEAAEEVHKRLHDNDLRAFSEQVTRTAAARKGAE